jgi:hypothetical protein
MKILFLGPNQGNAYIQYLILKKKFKIVDFINPFKAFIFKELSIRIFIRLNPFLFEKRINSFLLKRIRREYDLIYVKCGELISENLILELKKKTKKIIYFCNDNPFVKRDKKRWKLFLPASKHYDLIIFQDKSRLKYLNKWKIKKNLLLPPPYDPNNHKKMFLTKKEKIKYKNQVIFIGTWSPKKGEFLKKLIDYGLNLKIYGSRWNRDPEYRKYKSNIKLGHVKNPLYAKLIQSSKIAICLFNEGHQDTITARSVEIPAIGTAIFSYKTDAMQKILKDNEEAIYFKTPFECYKKCIFYLKNVNLLKSVAQKGQLKITKKLKLTNNNFLDIVIKETFKKNLK